jgi:phosphoenolpyruvate-protein phosphotransferase (PTS system enzyme I)
MMPMPPSLPWLASLSAISTKDIPMPARRIRGTIASTGYAEGPLHRVAAVVADYIAEAEPASEAARLRAAIAAAASDLEVLVVASDTDAADILEFQLVMLGDDSLAEAAFAAIADGRPALEAWHDALATQIADYEGAADAYFRARAADLRDIADRVSRHLTGAAAEATPAGAILHADDLSPSTFLATDWGQGGGIVLASGSPTSHVAMLARARGVPMLTGLGALDIPDGDHVQIDAEHGTLVILPDTEDRRAFLTASTAYRHLLQQAVTVDGAKVDVLLNIGAPGDLAGLDPSHCDGIGLMRTEFLFSTGVPDEETQYRAYREVLLWAAGRPVTIRTVDAGGDKPVPGFTVQEGNPFLGLRGIRLALSRPDVIRAQIRALLRAAVHGPLKVMFPMVAIPAEFAAAAALFVEEAAQLAASGIAHAMPALGIMVEVPAVALVPEAFASVAFFSIGSNDLTQYVMAAGRDNGAVAALADPVNPAVIGLIARVAHFGAKAGIAVSLCGDAGGDPQLIPTLLGAGLRSLSVAPAQLPLAKAAIAAARTSDFTVAAI